MIRTRRRAPHERVDPFRFRVHHRDGERLRERLEAWSDTVQHRVADAWPAMPDGIEDRNADVWEPLLDVADGTWPERARLAAVALVADLQERKESLGIRLPPTSARSSAAPAM